MALSRKEIEALVAEMAEEIAARQGVEVVDVEYVKERGEYFLRVFIDKPGGVGLDDCQSFSEVLSDRLDEVDPIPGRYSLEVSSPGLERPLKKREDYRRFAGRKVQLRTFAPIDGRKNWQGTLLGLEGEEIALEVDGKTVRLPLESVARARLLFEFDL